MKFERCSGVLMHPTSLPGKFGIGTLGTEAYDFVNFLVLSGQKLWQVLPLGPTGYGDSPYQCFSAFAGNPLLINLEILKKEGLLEKKDLPYGVKFNDKGVDYGKLFLEKYPILKKAFENFKISASNEQKGDFNEFSKRKFEWLPDYGLFMALKDHFGGIAWSDWPEDIRFRKSSSLNHYRKLLNDNIEFQYFMQYQFFKQWLDLKNYTNSRSIKIIGDIPIFIAYDSSDAWAHSELFCFDDNKIPVKVAGVPPDYFSKTGQLWGNPIYNWKKLEELDYQWWISRFNAMFELVDITRVDHFRGFAGYWAVPFGEETAVKGKWESGPGKKFFAAVEKSLGNLPIIAEDLGFITPDVIELREAFDYPGMKVLQFAFDSDENNDYLPHHYKENCVVYTGTHDNDTIIGWYNKRDENVIKFILEYTHITGKEINWDLIILAMSSKAVFSIVPLQDLLSLGSEARMNTPGTSFGNWQWRFKKSSLTKSIAKRLNTIIRKFDR